MRLGGYRLVHVHTLLVLRHVAAVHEQLAIAHRQVERHARIVGIGRITLLEHAGRRRIVLAVERLAALDLVDLGYPLLGLGRLLHVAVELGQLGRLGKVVGRRVVVLALDARTAQHEVALGQRGLGRSDHVGRRRILAVDALVDHLLESCRRGREILLPVGGGPFVVSSRKILRRERHRSHQRDYRNQ